MREEWWCMRSMRETYERGEMMYINPKHLTWHKENNYIKTNIYWQLYTFLNLGPQATLLLLYYQKRPIITLIHISFHTKIRHFFIIGKLTQDLTICWYTGQKKDVKGGIIFIETKYWTWNIGITWWHILFTT